MSNKKKYKTLRERWDKEDNLLLSRTGIFLTVNSILCAGAQLQQEVGFRSGVAIFSIIISLLWLTTSWHSCNLIMELYRKCKTIMPGDLEEIYGIRPVLFRPTASLGIVLPCIVISGWIVYAGWNLLMR